MTLLHGFVQTSKFYDDVHFVQGFSRSGHFTIVEANLLTDIGKRLFMLESGQVEPENQVEQNFVSVCHGHRQAETRLERLWIKYKSVIKNSNKFYGLNSSTKSSNLEINANLEDTY